MRTRTPRAEGQVPKVWNSFGCCRKRQQVEEEAKMMPSAVAQQAAVEYMAVEVVGRQMMHQLAQTHSHQ